MENRDRIADAVQEMADVYGVPLVFSNLEAYVHDLEELEAGNVLAVLQMFTSIRSSGVSRRFPSIAEIRKESLVFEVRSAVSKLIGEEY